MAGYPSYETNLCPYLRMVFKGFLCFCIAAFIGSLVAIGNVLTIVSMVQGNYFDVADPAWFHFASVGTLVFIVILGWHIGKDYLVNYLEKRRQAKRLQNWDKQPTVKRPKEPSLIGIWLKSVHDKICPNIDFKD
jgi:hypothetical protein